MGASTQFLLALIVALSAGIAQAGPVLKLRTGELDSDQLAKSTAVTTRHGIVQFATARQMNPDALRALGVEILAYLPDHAYVVRFGEAAAVEIRDIAGVHYVGGFDPRYKLAPGLRQSALSKSADAGMHLEITGFRGESDDAIAGVVRKHAPASRPGMIRSSHGIPYVRVRVDAVTAPALLDHLAALDAVAWIDRYSPPRIHNADSVGAIQNNSSSGGVPPTATPIWDQDLIGTGQIVAVVDSGVDRNEPFFLQHDNGQGPLNEITDAELVVPPAIGTLHPDRKVVGYWFFAGSSPYDDNEKCGEDGTRGGYHGTHVAGSVLGDSGTPSTPTEPNYDPDDGMAPNAQLLVLDVGNDETGCLGGFEGATHGDLGQLSLSAGAYLLSASIGSSPPSDDDGNLDPSRDGYFFSDFTVDSVAYQNEDLLMMFSAGNNGDEAGSRAVSHPAAAKHALAVGATGHGNDSTRAGFSSPGPAFDGRIKPEIMAPGVDIRSAAGNDSDTNPLPTFRPPTARASSKQGTSMATPTVAGGAALLRQYFTDGFYPSGTRNEADRRIPSGALMKAALLNGTSTYSDTPSNSTGFGGIWLNNSLYFAGDDRGLRVWDRPNAAGLRTGESIELQVEVAAGSEFRTTLVWRDPPASGFTGAALVNDLDLEVLANGTTYRGNVYSGGQSTTGGNADRVNPTEQVRIVSPEAGTYTLRVKATSVPGNGTPGSDRQGFSLVASAAQCTSGVSSAPQLELSSDASGIAVQLTTVSGAQTYEVSRAPGSCSESPERSRFIGATATDRFLDQTSVGGFEYAYRVRGVDACGEGPVSVCKSIVSTAACQLVPEFDETSIEVARADESSCEVSIQWAPGEAACPGAQLRYDLFRSTDPLFEPSAESLIASGLSGTSFTDSNTDSLTTYYYAVRAIDSEGNQHPGFTRKAITTRAATSSPGEFVDDPDLISLVDLEGIWQVSEAFSSTGDYSYHNARPGETYPNLTCARIVSPAIQLQSGQPVLSYDARFDLEADWDGVVVEISTDGGASWQDLPPDQGYPGDFSMTEPEGTPINQCGYPASQGAFNGEQNSFTEWTSDLSAHAGQEVLIRWSFSSDPGAEFDGFYLDNIRVSQGSTPDACIAGSGVKRSGPWFNTEQSGHGWFIEHLEGAGAEAPDRINAYWYVYQDAQAVWLIGQGDLIGNRAELDVFQTSGADFPPEFDPAAVELVPWGSLVFDFDGETTGTASWDSLVAGFGAGELDMQQIAPIAEDAQACGSGSYYNVDQSGHGFVAQVLNINGELQVLLAWYVYLDGEQVWLLGQAPLVDGAASVPMGRFTGGDFPPDFDPQSVVNQPWGTVSFQFDSAETATAAWSTTVPGFSDGSTSLLRLTSLKGHACP